MASSINAAPTIVPPTSQELPSVTTTTKTEYHGLDGKVLHSTVDENGKPIRIHKVITTTTTVTSFGDDSLASSSNRTAEEKFVDHAKKLSVDTKDVLLHTAESVQHALGTASEYVRHQLAPSPSENAPKATENDQNDLLHRAASLKDALIQKAVDVKDATVDAFKDLTAPQLPATIDVTHTTTTTNTTHKKSE